MIDYEQQALNGEFVKKLITIILLILSISIYSSDSFFSVKFGVNYSTIDVSFDNRKANTGYSSGVLTYISYRKSIFNDFYLSLDLGINQKGVKITADSNTYFFNSLYSIDLAFILGYTFLNKLNLYLGIYGSKTAFTNIKLKEVMIYYPSSESGLLFGIEYMYKNFLFDFRFQKGYYGSLIEKNLGDESLKEYNNSNQFIFMIAYRF